MACPFIVLINFHSIVLERYGCYMKVTAQNSKVCCRDLQKSHFMNAIVIFSGEFPVGAKPSPLEISAYEPGQTQLKMISRHVDKGKRKDTLFRKETTASSLFIFACDFGCS